MGLSNCYGSLQTKLVEEGDVSNGYASEDDEEKPKPSDQYRDYTGTSAHEQLVKNTYHKLHTVQTMDYVKNKVRQSTS